MSEGVVTGIIGFYTYWDNWTGLPIVGHYDASPPTKSVAGYFPLVEFPVWYDILRNERPVSLEYEPASPVGTSHPLTKLALITGLEMPGEGPADVSFQFEFPHVLEFDKKVVEAAVAGESSAKPTAKRGRSRKTA
jgi:hypothetical protein